MRRMMVRVTALLIASLGLVVVGGAVTSSVWACETVSPEGICLDGTVPAPPSPTPSEDPGGGGPGPECHDIYTGAPLPCTEPNAGVWFDPPGCYAFMLEPQPAAGDPLWEGHDPSEGSVWGCDSDFSDAGNTFFVPGAPPLVDAGDLALQLVARAPFEVADLRLAPDPALHSYVNVENWVWVPKRQWHDVSVSLTVNGATVTLTASPSKLQVDMGDGGGPLVCRTAGRRWVIGMGDAAQTSCAHAYRTVSTVGTGGGYDARGRFAVVGRLFYTVAWRCTGRCSAGAGTLPGEYPAPPGDEIQVEVRQRQTVVTQ